MDAGLGSTSSEKHGQFGTLDGTEQQFVKNFDRESVIEEPAQSQLGVRNPWILPTQMPKIDADDFDDPISDRFWNEVWNASAVHNVSSLQNLHTGLTGPRHPTIDRSFPQGVPCDSRRSRHHMEAVQGICCPP